jgi:hippurate hydrolase
MMAGSDSWEIIVTGKGAHGAMPHLGIDPIVVAAQIVTGLQTIVSRNNHPLENAVVTVTQFHGGDTWNVIPQEVMLRGTARYFRREVQDMIESRMTAIADSICAAYGATARVKYMRRYPPVVNSEAETETAARVLSGIVGESNVRRDLLPSMGGEDFAFMLLKKPGTYIWIGNGENQEFLHHPSYDFNDEILPLGASYWARLVEQILAKPA